MVKWNKFDIEVSGDGLPYTADQHYKTWFYFSVVGTPVGEILTFSVKNTS